MPSPPRPRPRRRRRHPVATAAPAALALLLLLGALGAAAQVGRGKRLPECALVSATSSSCKIRRGGKKLVMKNPRVEVTGLSLNRCFPDCWKIWQSIFFWWQSTGRPIVVDRSVVNGRLESMDEDMLAQFFEEIEYFLESDAVDRLESRLLLPKRFAKQCAATYATPPTSSTEDWSFGTAATIEGAVLFQREAVIGAVPRYAKTKSTGVEKLIYDVETETREALGSSAGGCNLYLATPCQTDAQP